MGRRQNLPEKWVNSNVGGVQGIQPVQELALPFSNLVYVRFIMKTVLMVLMVFTLSACHVGTDKDMKIKNVSLLGSDLGSLTYIDTVKGYDLYIYNSNGVYLSYQFPVNPLNVSDLENSTDLEQAEDGQTLIGRELVESYIKLKVNEASLTELKGRIKELKELLSLVYEEHERLEKLLLE